MSNKKFIKAKSLKKHKYLSGTKGLNDGFNDLVPGNTTQYAPDEKFFNDTQAPASDSNATIDFGAKKGIGKNTPLGTSSVNKKASPNLSNNYRDNFFNMYGGNNFSNNFNNNFNEDMFWDRGIVPMRKTENIFRKNNTIYNYRKYRSNAFNKIPSQEILPQKPNIDVPEFLTPKTPKFSIEQPKDNLTIKQLPTVNSTKPVEEISKTPKTAFARYTNKQGFFDRMKGKLGGLLQNRTVNSKAVNNISATGPSFVSGAKSVKQYRKDENLPEAKNGMKNCGCKHPKSKYKYGTGAIMIPENSAIVTAKNGMNKAAIDAHLRGDHEEVERIIKKMPADSNYKKKEGDGKTLPLYDESKKMKNKRLRSSDALSQVPKDQHKSGNLYGKVTQEQFEELKKNNPWYDWSKFDISKPGDVQKFQESFNSLSTILGSSARLEVDDKLGEQTATAKVDYTGDIPEEIGKKEENTDKTKEDIFATNKRKGDFLRNIPSLAEVAAKSSLLAQGIEGVPEKYLTLAPYEYASQLPKTLREIQLSEQEARGNARDIVGGDAGRYLSLSGAYSAARQKAATDAVTQDTLARQNILNLDKDKLNEQAKINLELGNAYSQQKAANRGAYNNMLVSLGQSIDTATDASKLMASQRENDDIKIKLLETGNYMMNPDGTVVLKQAKKGIKRLKTYKRK